MPEFCCVQCFSCSTYQVQQVKKVQQFNCKLCNEKQSVRKVYAISAKAKDVRDVVQRLNMERGQREANQATFVQDGHYFSELHGERSTDVQAQVPLMQANTQRLDQHNEDWSKYIDNEHQNCAAEDEAGDEGLYVTCLDQPSTVMKGITSNSSRSRATKRQRTAQPSDTTYPTAPNQVGIPGPSLSPSSHCSMAHNVQTNLSSRQAGRQSSYALKGTSSSTGRAPDVQKENLNCQMAANAQASAVTTTGVCNNSFAACTTHPQSSTGHAGHASSAHYGHSVAQSYAMTHKRNDAQYAHVGSSRSNSSKSLYFRPPDKGAATGQVQLADHCKERQELQTNPGDSLFSWDAYIDDAGQEQENDGFEDADDGLYVTDI